MGRDRETVEMEGIKKPAVRRARESLIGMRSDYFANSVSASKTAIGRQSVSSQSRITFA